MRDRDRPSAPVDRDDLAASLVRLHLNRLLGRGANEPVVLGPALRTWRGLGVDRAGR